MGNVKKVIFCVMFLLLPLLSPLHAELIDGPTNIRENPNGKDLFVLEHKTRVEVSNNRGVNDWYFIGLSVWFKESGLFGKPNIPSSGTQDYKEGSFGFPGKIAKDMILYGKNGQVIGKTLNVVSSPEFYLIFKDNAMYKTYIEGYIHKDNILNNYVETDWVFEPGEQAFVIYSQKQIKIPCSEIGDLLDQSKYEQVYKTLRDAGLFRDKTCAFPIKKESKRFNAKLRSVAAFYNLRMGDSSYLTKLVEIFDKEAGEIGDHYVVELFGFLPDWEESGRRLVRLASHADGSAAEVLCSALVWRRFLYGEEAFKANWFKYGKEEGVNDRVLEYFHEKCNLSLYSQVPK